MVKVPDFQGVFKVMLAAQVIGLAVEQAHKKAKDVGLGNLTIHHLTFVSWSPALGVKILRGSRWVHAASATVSVSVAAAKLVIAIVHKQRRWFNDMGLNIWHVDVYRVAVKKGVDMIADFSNAKSNYGIAGLVFVELKAGTRLKVIR